MTTPFITERFLLETDTAAELYRRYAESLPIIDYHSHVSARAIAEDRRFENLTRIWLDGDHYKWRAMRANGVDERFITGDAGDRERFLQWAETVPRTLRNPLFHWTHLELARHFGIDDLLSPKTAASIWDRANERLTEPDFSCRRLIERSNVEVLCTTDDPIDSLDHHAALAVDGDFPVTVLPTWRPDRGLAIEDPDEFNSWVDRLAESVDVDVRDYSSFLEALRRRHDFFHTRGCRLSDHGLEAVWAEDCSEVEVRSIFGQVRSGVVPDATEAATFKSALLHELAVMNHEKGWAQQFTSERCATCATGSSLTWVATRVETRLATASSPAPSPACSIGSIARASSRRRSSTT